MPSEIIHDFGAYYHRVNCGVIRELGGQLIIFHNPIDAEQYYSKIKYCHAEDFTIEEAIQMIAALVEQQNKKQKQKQHG